MMTIGEDALAAQVAPAMEGPPERPSDTSQAQARAEAARQFEGLLLNQLMQAMRKSAPMFDSGQGKMYMQMFDSAIAEHLSKSGGIGLAPMIEQALGGGKTMADAVSAHGGAQQYGRQAPQPLTGPDGFARAGQPVSLMGAPAPGHTRALQRVASEMVLGASSRWSKQGALRPEDLASDFATDDAHFNVRDAQGYQGYPKCNLFAFEVARRAGFHVPVVPRAAGWGFPNADSVTAEAASGRLSEGWGKVVTGAPAEALDEAAKAGSRAFVLAGSGNGEAPGHMAVVERVHRVEYDQRGHIERVVFDGWEARTRGAQHLTHRTWNRFGNPGGTLARSGFGRIEIIELSPASPGEAPELPLADAAPRSFRDILPSSPGEKGPIPR